MGSIARSLLLVAGCALVAVLTLVAPLTAAGTQSLAPASDEDQVRTVLTSMNGSYKQADCAGPTQITVNSVDVTGGPHPRAVANVSFVAANHPDAKILDVDFLREGTSWKACRYHARLL